MAQGAHAALEEERQALAEKVERKKAKVSDWKQQHQEAQQKLLATQLEHAEQLMQHQERAQNAEDRLNMYQSSQTSHDDIIKNLHHNQAEQKAIADTLSVEKAELNKRVEELQARLLELQQERGALQNEINNKQNVLTHSRDIINQLKTELTDKIAELGRSQEETETLQTQLNE